MKKLLLSLTLVLPLLAIPQAAQAAAKLTLTPTTVYPKAAPCSGINDFTVSGTGFKPNETIALSVGPQAYDSFQADGAGAYSETNEIKAMPSGYYPVKLVGDKGTKAQAEIRLGWAGCWTRSHGVLTVRGAGFAADDEIDVILNGQVAETTETDSRGRFETQVDCPEQGDPTLAVQGTARSLNVKTVDC